MEYKGIILAGKSVRHIGVIAKSFCEKYGHFQQIDDVNDIKHDVLEGVIKENRVTTLIVPAYLVEKLKDTEELNQMITIFIDDSGETPGETARKCNDSRPNHKRKEEMKCAEECHYVIKGGENVGDVTELIYYLWKYRNTGGMLSKNLIRLMIKCGMLLGNANTDNIQGASYDLSLGDEYFRRGKIETLDDKKPFITMEPGDYVLASSKEYAIIPRDIAGRFDLRVSLFFKGVILSNGPQVDPGFKGPLFCLLFNTSNEKIELKRGEHLATIEFIKLIEHTVIYRGYYHSKKNISDYLPNMAKESAINKLVADVKKLKRVKFWVITLPTFIAIAALVVSIIGLYRA